MGSGAGELLGGVAIALSAEDHLYPLGGPIPLAIAYRNGSAQVHAMREPEKTWEVKLLLDNAEQDGVDLPFGRITYHRYGDLERRVIEDAAVVELAPGQVHAFGEDLGLRWPQFVVPGRNAVQVKDESDDAATRLSNKIVLRVTFDDTTVPLLLDQAVAADASEDLLLTAERWIDLLKPDFQLTAGGDPAAVAARQQQVQAARDWWNRERGSAPVRARISEINQNFQRP